MEAKKHKFVGDYKVYFPQTAMAGMNMFFLGLEIHQKIRQHDTATVRVRTQNAEWFVSLGTGAPVSILYYGDDRVSQTFVGYVTQVHPVGSNNNFYEYDIVCVAASRALRETARETYTNKTAPEIAQIIADRVGFKLVTVQHGLRRPTVVQSGETYWEFLTKLAKRTGYVLRVEQTTIFFMPLMAMVSAYSSRSPYLTDYGNATSTGYVSPRVYSIESWVGDASDDPEDLSDSAVVTSINPVTGVVVEARATPGSVVLKNRKSKSSYTKYSTGTVVHNQADAVLLAQGIADSGLMAFDAVLLAGGNAILKPYQPVILDIRNGRMSGVWVVKEVIHSFKLGVYDVTVTVSTDSIDGESHILPTPKTNPKRDIPQEMAQKFSPDTSVSSRLKTVGTGFVVGKVGAGGSTGKWVSAV